MPIPLSFTNNISSEFLASKLFDKGPVLLLRDWPPELQKWLECNEGGPPPDGGRGTDISKIDGCCNERNKRKVSSAKAIGCLQITPSMLHENWKFYCGSQSGPQGKAAFERFLECAKRIAGDDPTIAPMLADPCKNIPSESGPKGWPDTPTNNPDVNTPLNKWAEIMSECGIYLEQADYIRIINSVPDGYLCRSDKPSNANCIPIWLYYALAHRHGLNCSEHSEGSKEYGDCVMKRIKDWINPKVPPPDDGWFETKPYPGPIPKWAAYVPKEPPVNNGGVVQVEGGEVIQQGFDPVRNRSGEGSTQKLVKPECDKKFKSDLDLCHSNACRDPSKGLCIWDSDTLNPDPIKNKGKNNYCKCKGNNIFTTPKNQDDPAVAPLCNYWRACLDRAEKNRQNCEKGKASQEADLDIANAALNRALNS